MAFGKGADGGSADYMLDTMDGTITKYTNSGPVFPDSPGVYGADDPRAWRDEWCEDRTVALLQQTREWRTQYRTLALLGMPGNRSWPGVLVRAPKDGFMWEETEVRKPSSLFFIQFERQKNTKLT